MLVKIPQRSFRLLVRHVRRLLIATGVSAVPVGFLAWLIVAGKGIPMPMAWVFSGVLFIASMHLNVVVLRSKKLSFEQLVSRFTSSIGSALISSSAAFFPILFAYLLFILLGHSEPLVAFLLGFIFVLAAPLFVTLIFLTVVATSYDGGGLFNLSALRVVMSNKRDAWLFSVALWIPISFICLPVILLGFMLIVFFGPLSFVGYGIALTAPVPLLAAVSLSFWRSCNAGDLSAPSALEQGGFIEQQPVGEWVWIPSYAWRVFLEPHGLWGVWIDVESDQDKKLMGISFTMRETQGNLAIHAPRLLSCDVDENWLEWPLEKVDGSLLVVELSSGQNYIQLISTSEIPINADLAIAVYYS